MTKQAKSEPKQIQFDGKTVCGLSPEDVEIIESKINQQAEEIEGLELELAEAKFHGEQSGNLLLKSGLQVVQQREEIEKLQMQLAACGVGALSNTMSAIASQRITQDNPHYSASLSDVYRAVDREIALRDEVEKLKAESESRWQLAESSINNSAKMSAELGALQSRFDELVKSLEAISGQLYFDIPTGTVSAFELIQLLKKHCDGLEFIISKAKGQANG